MLSDTDPPTALGLLMECSRPGLANVDRIRRALDGAVDPMELWGLAKRHRLLPWLFLVLDEHAKDLLEEETLAFARSEFQASDGSDISGAAPYACIICHMDFSTFRPSVVDPRL